MQRLELANFRIIKDNHRILNGLSSSLSFAKRNMSDRKGSIMGITDLIQKSCRDMGMLPMDENPFAFGKYYSGDSITSNGFFWYMTYEDLFSVTKCDFTFLRPTTMTMANEFLYLALRLDYAAHLPPGKILGFFEERGNQANVVMPAGRRVAYTEVLFVPEFYKDKLGSSLTSPGHDPINILKKMGREHNWSSEIIKVLTDIYHCDMKGMSAELYCIGKSYELLSSLIEMGNRRLPQKPGDYDDIARVIDYIDMHFRENIRQETLVRLAHMSPTKLKNLFRSFTGSTITEYILSRKIDFAGHQLAETNDSIEGIAGSIGFKTPTGFATSFKKLTGMSPTEYRKQIKYNCINNPSQIQDLDI